jgi:hypothetical protein
MSPPIGFSTGALALSDFRAALAMLAGKDVRAVELSALRVAELDPLLDAIPLLDLGQFEAVSVHAPSAFSLAEERTVVEGLRQVARRGWPIVVHPDSVHEWAAWRELGPYLLIENMDKRKPVGRTVQELVPIFDTLPDARLCFDIAHARQYDGSMTEAYRILKTFGSRVAQVHVSEVSSGSAHERISRYAVLAFQKVARMIPTGAPVIIESRVTPDEIESEIEAARAALQPLELRQTA